MISKFLDQEGIIFVEIHKKHTFFRKNNLKKLRFNRKKVLNLIIFYRKTSDFEM